jgi:tRNA 2-thiouridine synthesizing protein E
MTITITDETAIAREHGLDELTERHWLVIRYLRERYEATGETPTVRAIGKESGVSVKELYELFPKAPGKLAALIAGVPKPRGCI